MNMIHLGKQRFYNNVNKKIRLTTRSFPAFSGLGANSIAAAAAAPDEIPTCREHATTFSKEMEYCKNAT